MLWDHMKIQIYTLMNKSQLLFQKPVLLGVFSEYYILYPQKLNSEKHVRKGTLLAYK